ncbi:MAG: tetratricopeptide repeat protein [Chloroflexi bacterium]|nr:tetratricopeptide repeat protein [Chloroflexota bacterium]
MLLSDLPFLSKVRAPQPRPETVARPRLLEQLNEHVGRRLTMVVAPAGYGKTTLLAEFAVQAPFPVCWYAADAADDEVGLFTGYLVAAIRQRFPGFGQRLESFLATAPRRDARTLMGLLANEIQQAVPQRFALVVEDFHVFGEGSDVLTAVNELLTHLPDQCRLVLSSRTIPPLMIARLLAQLEVGGLSIKDLRFTAGEAGELLGRLGQDPAVAEALVQRFDGWVSGLVLAAQSREVGREDAFSSQWLEGAIFRYLAEEVFEQYPAWLRRFLCESAVLGSLDPAGCDELLGRHDSTRILEQIGEGNLFINRIDGPEAIYRYHDLFRRFLLNKLTREHPKRHRELQAKAAASAAARSDWTTALEHAHSCGQPDVLAEHLETAAGPLYDSGQLRTLARYLEELPRRHLTSRPALLWNKARAALRLGDVDQARTLLAKVYETCRAGSRPDLAGRALALRSDLLRRQGRLALARRDCELALELLPETEPAARAEVRQFLGMALFEQGEIDRAVGELQAALAYAETTGDRYSSAWLHHNLGYAYERSGDVIASLPHYEQALRYWEQLHNVGDASATLNSIAAQRYQLGHLDEAERLLARALDSARQTGLVHVQAFVLATRGDVERDSGRLEDALASYQAAQRFAEEVGQLNLIAYCDDAIGIVYRRRGELDRAEQMARRALHRADEQQWLEERARYALSLGIVLYRREQLDQSLRHLTKAITTLGQIGARRDLARAHLHLAQAQLLSKSYRAATDSLRRSLELVAELGYSHFFQVEARELQPLLQFARRRGVSLPPELVAGFEDESSADGALTPPSRETDRLEARLFGTSEVFWNGVEISPTRWHGPKTRELLLYLLHRPGWSPSVQAMEALWPEQLPKKQRDSFEQAIVRLRKALGPEIVSRSSGRVRLNERVEVITDADTFERLVGEARIDPSDAAIPCFEQACSLYRGPYLDDQYGDWCEKRREELARAFLDALRELGRRRAAAGDFIGAAEHFRHLTTRNPDDELAWRERFRCVYHARGAAAAIALWSEYTQILRADLAKVPSQRMREYYSALVAKKRAS